MRFSTRSAKVVARCHADRLIGATSARDASTTARSASHKISRYFSGASSFLLLYKHGSVSAIPCLQSGLISGSSITHGAINLLWCKSSYRRVQERSGLAAAEGTHTMCSRSRGWASLEGAIFHSPFPRPSAYAVGANHRCPKFLYDTTPFAATRTSRPIKKISLLCSGVLSLAMARAFTIVITALNLCMFRIWCQ